MTKQSIWCRSYICHGLVTKPILAEAPVNFCQAPLQTSFVTKIAMWLLSYINTRALRPLHFCFHLKSLWWSDVKKTINMWYSYSFSSIWARLHVFCFLHGLNKLISYLSVIYLPRSFRNFHKNVDDHHQSLLTEYMWVVIYCKPNYLIILMSFALGPRKGMHMKKVFTPFTLGPWKRMRMCKAFHN